MRALAWSSSMSFGMETIDLAHQTLLRALAQFPTSQEHQIRNALPALTGCMQACFVEEERVMEVMDFSELVAHRGQHQRVLQSLGEIESAIEQGGVDVARSTLELLPHWYLFHLSTMDMTLAATLQLANARPLANYVRWH